MNNIQTYTRTSRQPIALPQRQEGLALVLFVVGLLVIAAMGGLALDVSNALLNKSRLQNTVDAAALAGATVLEDTGSTIEAEIAARAVFAANSAAAGQREMARKVNPADVIVEFSTGLDPFISGSPDAEYVRVRVESFGIEIWLLQVMQLQGDDFTNESFRASAVAGPSPTLGSACDIVPLIICGDPAAPAPYYGYEDDQITVLKSGSQTNDDSGDIGPGNFQLAQLGGSGANIVRDNLAGGFEGCAQLNGTIPTQTGNQTGPVAQGINTRLGIYAGPISPGDFPPDVVTETPSSDLAYDDDAQQITFNGNPVTDSSQIDFNYADYEEKVRLSQYNNSPASGGAFDRRNMSVVIANCAANPNNGQSDLPVLGFGCFFLLQDVKQKGSEAEMYGEFVADCDAKGTVGPSPTNIPGPYLIQLYKDPDSGDS